MIITSCPAGSADQLARELVTERVAACVSVIPNAMSTYRWQGVVQRDQEHLLLIKAPSAQTAQLMEVLERKHPYDVPEIIALPVAHSSAAYSHWVQEMVTDGGGESSK
ncbi:MAG: divalent-cation tolerance protein CutA [Myxococcales bacterium]|nr:divalent-cation tolerance protein CutA [Myxococcales bacterium]